MDYTSTDYGIDNSSHSTFKAQTDRQTEMQPKTVSMPPVV